MTRDLCRQALLAATVLARGVAMGAEPIDDRTVLLRKGDPEMNQAIEAARRGLDDFLALAEHPPRGAEGFKLKVQFVEGQYTEHLWIVPFRRTSTGFLGIVSDTPDYVHDVKLGDRVQFTRDRISDWGYVQDGHQKGSYTVCVLFRRMQKEEVEQYRRDYGFDC